MNRILPSLALVCAVQFQSRAVLLTFAGTGAAGSGGDGGPALRAQLDNPYGLVRGPDAAIWFVDYAAELVRRIGQAGIITTEVGDGRTAYAGDGGPARAASLNNPHELRFDRSGNLFIADAENHVIRRLDAKTQILTTFAGNGKRGYSGDGGPAEKAQLSMPISLQFGPGGDLFIADIGNQVIRRVDAKTGVIVTFAGTGKSGPTPDDSPIVGTPLSGPRSLDFDADGNLWLVTREGNQVLKLDIARGAIRRMAGTGGKGFTGNGGPAREATLSGPKGIAVAPNGDVFIADTENHAIRRIDPNRGTMELIVGTGQPGAGAVGDPLKTTLKRPHGVFVDAAGTLFISDSENHRILKMTAEQLRGK